MECIVCNQKIKLGENVFYGTQMVYCGPGESDCEYSGAIEGLVGGVHVSCLESPLEIARTTNRVVVEPVEEKSESVVKRSDALSLLS